MLLIPAADASISPETDSALLVAPADGDVISSMKAASGVGLSASSRRALFIAVGVVLGIILVVVFLLGLTCTLKQCRRLRHTGQYVCVLCVDYLCCHFATSSFQIIAKTKASDLFLAS